MKFKSLTLMILAGLFAVSCSSDDDSTPDYASQIAKTYVGAVELSVSGNPVNGYLGVAKSLAISRVNNDSVIAVLTVEYGMGSPMAVEKVTAGATVTYQNEKYTLKGGETASTGMTATLTGEISSTSTEIKISFTPTGMPMPIVADFSSVDLSRTVTVDATDYMKWTYFSFKEGVVGTYMIYLDGDGEPNGTVVDANGSVVNESSFNWDIALHREDVRTNGGSALNTEKTKMDEVTTIPTSGYTADVDTEEKVIYDMSGMMTGNLKYAPFKLNEVLCTWLTKDLSSMPPVYTIHNYVYIIQTKGNEYAKIQFTDRTSDENVSGHITFTYEYPVE